MKRTLRSALVTCGVLLPRVLFAQEALPPPPSLGEEWTETAPADAVTESEQPLEDAAVRSDDGPPNAPALAADAPAAGDADKPVEPVPERVRPRELGLNPGVPQQAGAFGAGRGIGRGALQPENRDWRFDFQGFMMLPLSVGIAKVEDPAPGQSGFALHTRPQMADTWGDFGWSNVVPGTWTQLNFSYGNRFVTATTIFSGFSVSSANAWFNPASQLGIWSAFLTFDPLPLGDVRLLAHVGAFRSSYGYQARFDQGRYETPLLAATTGLGATVTAEYSAGDMSFQLEHGFKGNPEIAPADIRANSYTGSAPAGQGGATPGVNQGVEPINPELATAIGPAYGYPDAVAGTSFVHDVHAGVGYKDSVHLTLHYLHAFSIDDRTPLLPPTTTEPARARPDGHIDVYGADLRFRGGHLGHLYLGVNHTKLTDAATVGNVINILNAGAGAGIARFYLGPESQANGTLTAVGFQYDVSVGTLLRYPQPFWGEGPDVTLTLFGMAVHVDSADSNFDATKYKLGGEATYSMLSWLALQGRFDRIIPNIDDSSQDRSILTGRIIAKTEWVAHERVWLQYSRWLNGDGVRDPFTSLRVTDEDVVSLVGTIWW